MVPDNVTQRTVPQITGLLSYQKDVEVLRIRQNDAWKVLALEEKVTDYIPMLSLYSIGVPAWEHRVAQLPLQNISRSGNGAKNPVVFRAKHKLYQSC